MGRPVYLVTGAAGLVGSAICRELAERGEKVRGLVHSKAPNLPQTVEIFKGDLLDKQTLEPFFAVSEGEETVVLHIASVISLDPKPNEQLIRANVEGTDNIIDMCLAHKECRMMVYCSSTSAIPELPKGTPITETDEFKPDELRDTYSRSKARATENVLAAVKEKGLRACVIHPSGIFGPLDWSESETTSILIKIIKGKIPMGIKGSFNLVDVRDVAHGAVLAADGGNAGECYILAGDEISFEDFCKTISAESGCKEIKTFLPIGMGYFFGRVMEIWSKITGAKVVMTTFAVYNLDRNNNFRSDKAKKELGYTARPCRETVRDTALWLKEAGKI